MDWNLSTSLLDPWIDGYGRLMLQAAAIFSTLALDCWMSYKAPWLLRYSRIAGLVVELGFGLFASYADLYVLGYEYLVFVMGLWVPAFQLEVEFICAGLIYKTAISTHQSKAGIRPGQSGLILRETTLFTLVLATSCTS